MMLRLSKLSDYGTVIMAHMARDPVRVSSATELADALGVGQATVTKLLKKLLHEGLLVSQRGARGGYALARPPEAISLAQIINAVDGPLGMTECCVREGLCGQEPGCAVRGNWQRINRVIRDALEGTNLAEFAQPDFVPISVATMRPRQNPPLEALTCPVKP